MLHRGSKKLVVLEDSFEVVIILAFLRREMVLFNCEKHVE